MAVGLAFLAVLVFMVIYYRFAGMVACIALFANLLLTVGFMVAVNATFTLPGLAGLVLMLGMAVDANVLIYERLREERNKGANLSTAIRNGYDRAFPTIIDTHLTSIFTAIVLYTVGNDQLKGFAISLTVGLIISLFTSLYMTRLMFDYWQHKKWLTELKMMRLFERPNLHPMKYRFLFFPLTGALTVLGLALFLYRGEAGLNVDFRGGTVFAGQLKEGEERGLIKTSDGKLGFRELLGEENQKKRLTPTKAVWENKPVRKDNDSDAEWNAKVSTVNTFIYTITYADPDGKSPTAVVTLTHKPGKPGDYDDEGRWTRRCDRARAGICPTCRSSRCSSPARAIRKARAGTSRSARPRNNRNSCARASTGSCATTTGASLMFGAVMSYPETTAKVEDADRKAPVVDAAGTVQLEFTRPTSRAYVQELVEREFRTAQVVDQLFNITGTSDPVDGRYTKMKFDVSKNQAFDKTYLDEARGHGRRKPGNSHDSARFSRGQSSRSTRRPSRNDWKCSTASSPARRGRRRSTPSSPAGSPSSCTCGSGSATGRSGWPRSSAWSTTCASRSGPSRSATTCT